MSCQVIEQLQWSAQCAPPVSYLRVELASIVHERQADVVKATNLTSIVAEALKHTTANITGV